MAKKKTDDREPNFPLRFATPELRQEAERRAEEEGRTLTAHLNELVKADARKFPKADIDRNRKHRK